MEVQFCHLWASPSLPECRISPLLTDIAIIDHFSLTVLTWAHSRRFLILSCHQNSVSRSLLNSQVISQSQCKLTCLQDLTHVIVFFLKQSLPVFAKLYSSHFFFQLQWPLSWTWFLSSPRPCCVEMNQSWNPLLSYAWLIIHCALVIFSNVLTFHTIYTLMILNIHGHPFVWTLFNWTCRYKCPLAESLLKSRHFNFHKFNLEHARWTCSLTGFCTSGTVIITF